MHYHITRNRSVQGDYRYFNVYAVLPEVTEENLNRSSPECILRDGLFVIRQESGAPKQTLMDNNGRRRIYNLKGVLSLLETREKKGDSVSIDDRLLGIAAFSVKQQLDRLFGEQGYTVCSGRKLEEDDLELFLNNK